MTQMGDGPAFRGRKCRGSGGNPFKPKPLRGSGFTQVLANVRFWPKADVQCSGVITTRR